MTAHQIKNNNLIYEIIFVFIICLTALSLRSNGFKDKGRTTFDEALYVHMAYEMSFDIRHYNAINYSRQYVSRRPKKLPDYLWKKIFKHPPMYCYLILNSYKIHNNFGLQKTPIKRQAVRVSIWMGVLTVLAVYLIGRFISGPLVGGLAALFLTIDPVHWICSQKIWMETTITFFMVLSGLFYLYALKKEKGRIIFYILTGLSIGCAALTKYPGALAIVAVFLYTLFNRRDILKQPKWILIPGFMFLALLDWLFWNFDVYGIGFFLGEGKGFDDIRVGYTVLKKIIPLIVFAIGLFFGSVYLWKKKKITEIFQKTTVPSILKNKIVWMLIAAGTALFIARDDLIKIISALSLKYEPPTSWRMGFFAREPWYFYLKRLFLYFPIYIFAYFSPFFVGWRRKNPQSSLPVYFAGIICLFFILWGNYQSRYILPAVPWLLILSAYTIVNINKQIMALKNANLRTISLVILWAIVGLSIAKAVQVDLLLAVTNKPCYF
ncbi:glycosyltransferase family 39 protein [bacterium]|nr:glycosyltransferase family 39 protein [bacterium]